MKWSLLLSLSSLFRVQRPASVSLCGTQEKKADDVPQRLADPSLQERLTTPLYRKQEESIGVRHLDMKSETVRKKRKEKTFPRFFLSFLLSPLIRRNLDLDFHSL